MISCSRLAQSVRVYRGWEGEYAGNIEWSRGWNGPRFVGFILLPFSSSSLIWKNCVSW